MTGPTIHDLTATLQTGSIALSPKSLRVTMDEQWSPYIQGTLVCSIPLGSWAGRAASKPQNGSRATLALSRRDADGSGSPQSLTLDLGIRDSVIDYNESTITLEVASDEALLQDFANFGTAPDPSSTTLNSLLSNVLFSIPGSTLDTSGSTNPAIAGGLWYPGTTAWDHVTPSVQKANHRLWSVGAKTYYLAALPLLVAGSITLDKPKRAREVNTRQGDGWADACVITYRWTDISTGNVNIQYDSAWTPASPADVTKVLALTYDNTKYPGSGAAAAVLGRMNNRAVSVPYEAVSDYTARPGMTATMTLPGQTAFNKVLRSVSWSWPENTMTVSTRES